MVIDHFGRGPRRPAKADRLRMAAAVARRLSEIRHSEELVHAFSESCASEIIVISGGYRARALGFSATATAGRYQAVRNWVSQVLAKAKAAEAAR